MSKFYTGNGKTIRITDNSIGDGGEGEIYPIVSSHYKGCCVKLYSNQSDPDKMDKRRKKIEFMIKNPPTDLMGDNYIVCWPKETVFSNKQFVGFIMPLAFRGSEQLHKLCTLDGKGLSTAWQQKYDRATGNGLIARMKLCTNLAASIHRVYSLKKYIFADMKPQNILVTDESKISLIDLDSIQVSENSQIIFPASVSTAEYEPPEATSIKISTHLRLEESWDRFSMAVIFYEVLFGVHPYAASFSGQYQKHHAVSEYIINNLFVHGSGKNHVGFLPPPHKNFHKIPYELQNLFMRAFKDSTQRPSAEEFGKTFFDVIKQAATVVSPKKTALAKALSYIKTAVVFSIFTGLIVLAVLIIKHVRDEQKSWNEPTKEPKPPQPTISNTYNFPMKSCGKPTKYAKISVDMWYSVYIDNSIGINEARKYCEDAFGTKAEFQNGRKIIQMASFLVLNDAEIFVEELKKYFHQVEIGGVLSRVREPIYEFIDAVGRDGFENSVGRFKQKMKDLLKADSGNENENEAVKLNDEGRKYYQSGNYEDGEKNALLSIRYSASKVASWMTLGDILADKGEIEKAANCFIISYNFDKKKKGFIKLLQKRSAKSQQIEKAIKMALKDIKN